jgi:cyclase
MPLQTRVIPVLLLHKGGLYKTKQFKKPIYVGDPINAVRVFNEKEVDEIAIIDIDATRENKAPNISVIAQIASEAFMPMAYGGGITTIEQIKTILYNGVEKIIINKAAHTSPKLISKAASLFGNQSIVVSIDVKKVFLRGYRVFTDNGQTNTGLHPVEFAQQIAALGAGEILLNCIDKDGTFSGYELTLIEQVTTAVNIPVVAIGGAATVNDLKLAKQVGASGMAAGSMFVFQRPHRAVLISYPARMELQEFNSTKGL